MNQLTTQNPQALELLKGSFQLVQLERFFDVASNEPKYMRQLWIKPKAEHLINLKEKTIAEVELEKRGRTMNQRVKRYYILTSEFLAYKEKAQSTNIKKIMLFDRVKLQCHEIKENNGQMRYEFRFEKNKSISKIYTLDFKLYQTWKKELERHCILNTFQEKYQIEKLIGAGTFGKVYLLRQKLDNRRFAAKMFFKDSILKQKKGKESLLNEIRILKELDHPGIMKLYEVHESMLSVFLICELLEGGELLECLNEKKFFTELDCAIMLKSIIEPLAYMHSKGIMHRDIKPENLVLRTRGNLSEIVIADFGLSQELNKKFLHYRCGTPGYCGPEVLSSNKSEILDYDLKCDVYSVGCVFHYIIAGRHPFQEKFRKEVYKRNKKGQVNFEEPKLKKLSSSGFDLMKKMLCFEPKQRPTFQECLQHDFFKEAEKNSDHVLCFQPQSTFFDLLQAGNRSGASPGGSQEDTNSFVVGRSNIIKGRVDTVQEIGIAIDHRRTSVTSPLVRNDLKPILLTPVPSKSTIQKQQVDMRKVLEQLSSDLNKSNVAEDEPIDIDDDIRPVIGADAKQQFQVHKKVRNLTTKGVISSPFQIDRLQEAFSS